MKYIFGGIGFWIGYFIACLLHGEMLDPGITFGIHIGWAYGTYRANNPIK